MSRQSEYRSTSRYPAERVFAVMTDAEYLRARLAKIGGKDAALLEHTVDAEGVRFHLRQGLDARDLPPMVRTFLAGDIVIERVETWTRKEEGRYEGETQVTIAGTPASAVATSRLGDTGGGSELVVVTDVTVGVPLIGGTVESIVAERVKELLALESGFTREWLETH